MRHHVPSHPVRVPRRPERPVPGGFDDCPLCRQIRADADPCLVAAVDAFQSSSRDEVDHALASCIAPVLIELSAERGIAHELGPEDLEHLILEVLPGRGMFSRAILPRLPAVLLDLVGHLVEHGVLSPADGVRARRRVRALRRTAVARMVAVEDWLADLAGGEPVDVDEPGAGPSRSDAR